MPQAGVFPFSHNPFRKAAQYDRSSYAQNSSLFCMKKGILRCRNCDCWERFRYGCALPDFFFFPSPMALLFMSIITGLQEALLRGRTPAGHFLSNQPCSRRF